MEKIKKKIKKVWAWFKVKPRKNNGLISANFKLIKYKDILYCTSDNGVKNVITIGTKTGKVYDDRCLNEFEEVEYFCRVSRNTIVNLAHVDSRNDWNVIYIGDYKFKVGRNYKENLKFEIEKII